MSKIDTRSADSVPRPQCVVCGALGRRVYQSLTDRLFSIEGKWGMSRCANEACDLYWLDPAPSASILPSFYASYHTHTAEPEGGRAKTIFTDAVNGYLARRLAYVDPGTWISRLGGWFIGAIPTLRDDAKARVFWLKAQQGSRLLEVGFGNGATLARLKALGWSVSGVEFDPVSVNLALARGIDARLGTLEECKFDSASFDAVVSSHLIEHLPNPRGYLEECARILSPGGKLILTTPNAVSLGHRLFRQNWRGLEPPRHLYVFGPHALQRLAMDAGFRRVKITTTARGGHIFSQSLRLAMRRDPKGAGRIEVELMALISWFVTRFVGPMKGEELCLECER